MKIKIGLYLALLALPSFAAPMTMTWEGQISDSMCGADHSAMGGGKSVNAHDCTLACTKSGAKFVLVSAGKVLAIVNQKFADLGKFSGQNVSLTGEMSEDGKGVTVTKVAAH